MIITVEPRSQLGPWSPSIGCVEWSAVASEWEGTCPFSLWYAGCKTVRKETGHTGRKTDSVSRYSSSFEKREPSGEGRKFFFCELFRHRAKLFSYGTLSVSDCCKYVPMLISACNLRQERRFPRFGARLYAMVSLRISIGCPSLFRNWCNGVSPCGVETTRRHSCCITGAGGFAG